MKYDKNIIFRIDEESKKQLEKYCNKNNVQVSDLIRELINKRIKEFEPYLTTE